MTAFPVILPPGSYSPCPFGSADGAYCVPPFPSHAHGRRTLNLLAIAYAGQLHQPRLRSRLTLGRLPWPRNP